MQQQLEQQVQQQPPMQQQNGIAMVTSDPNLVDQQNVSPQVPPAAVDLQQSKLPHVGEADRLARPHVRVPMRRVAVDPGAMAGTMPGAGQALPKSQKQNGLSYKHRTLPVGEGVVADGGIIE